MSTQIKINKKQSTLSDFLICFFTENNIKNILEIGSNNNLYDVEKINKSCDACITTIEEQTMHGIKYTIYDVIIINQVFNFTHKILFHMLKNNEIIIIINHTKNTLINEIINQQKINVMSVYNDLILSDHSSYTHSKDNYNDQTKSNHSSYTKNPPKTSVLEDYHYNHKNYTYLKDHCKTLENQECEFIICLSSNKQDIIEKYQIS